jgi:hypothetical protein
MVLRCSLLGHDYGETEVEREREERGSEVVVTVREYEECTRCGTRDVISENTEVRSLASADDAETPPTEPEPNPAPEPVDEPTGIEATFIDTAGVEPEADTPETPADESTSVPEPTPSTVAPVSGVASEPELDLPTDENGEPVRDDGEILSNDDSPARERGHGEWPDADDVGSPLDDDDTDAWSTEEEDEGPWPDEESAPLDDDAILLDTGPTTGGLGGLNDSIEHESDADRADSAPPAARTDETYGSGIERASSAPVPGREGGTPTDAGSDELHCPQCGFAGSGRNSLRSGDICPKCKKGYLGDQARR